MNIHNDALPTKCKECGTPLRPNNALCTNPKCRTWNLSTQSNFDYEQYTVLLSDATLPNVKRIHTYGLVDYIFGGGIAETSVNLLAGEPGAGKTTLCLQLSDIVAGITQREALYIANEQEASELRDTAARLCLKNASLIRVVKGMGGLTFDLGEMLMRYKPCLILLDSVTKWSGDDPEMAVTICQRLKDYSVSLRAPSLVINQVTKGGDHAGLNKMQHAVDATLMFEILHENEEEVSSKQTVRHLWSSKNRFGPAPEEQFYMMTSTGLVSIPKPGEDYPTTADETEESESDTEEEDSDETETL